MLAWASVALGAAAAAAQDPGPSPALTASRALKLSGYVQALSTAQSDGLDGLSIHRARFTLAGRS